MVKLRLRPAWLGVVLACAAPAAATASAAGAPAHVTLAAPPRAYAAASAAGAPAHVTRAAPPRAHAASRYPDVDCTLDLRQRPHFSTTGRRHGTSEVVWKVAVKCLWGKFAGGHFVSSGVPAVVPFMHVRMALYRNGGQVGQSSVDKPAVSHLTVPVAARCTAGAIYQGWGKAVAVLPPGVRDRRTGTQFAINQGWGNQRRITRCA